MTRKKITVITAALALIIAGTVTYATFAVKPHTAQDNGQIAQVTVPQPKPLAPPTVQELLELVNAERAKAGVAPLKIDERVQKSAQLKADDMEKNNYTAHIMPSTGKVLSPEMNDLLVSACSKSSENYYSSTKELRTADSAFNWWMNSKPHHDAILNPDYSLTGFGIAWGEKMIVVEHFCIAR